MDTSILGTLFDIAPDLMEEIELRTLVLERVAALGPIGRRALAHHVAAAAGAKGRVNGKGLCVELCGVCTDICVVSNALLFKAALPEADLVVDSALCAGVTPAKHEAALETLRSCQIVVK